MESTIVREDDFQLEDDESEVDVLLLQLENMSRAYFRNRRIERLMRKPITRIGYIYIYKALKEDQERFRQVYRMYPEVFLKLCDLIREQTSLRGTNQTCLEEMVATFLLTIGHNSRYNYTMDTFRRSKFAASTNFHKVLKALNTIAPSLMAKPGLTVPTKIRESTRYYHSFNVCLLQNILQGTFQDKLNIRNSYRIALVLSTAHTFMQQCLLLMHQAIVIGKHIHHKMFLLLVTLI